MILHQELADTLNHYLSFATIVLGVLVLLWVIDLIVIRLKYGPYAFIRKVYVLISSYFLPIGFFFSLAVSTLTLVYSEYIGYAPCFLCWMARAFLYPLTVVFFVAWLKKDYAVYRYAGALSLVGIIISAYHHYLQLGYNPLIPCGNAGVFADCAVPSFVEFGFVTFPLMGLVTFSFLFLLSYTMRLHTKVKK